MIEAIYLQKVMKNVGYRLTLSSQNILKIARRGGPIFKKFSKTPAVLENITLHSTKCPAALRSGGNESPSETKRDGVITDPDHTCQAQS